MSTAETTLWNVDDQATAVLMECFYGRMNEDLSKAEALRQAQLELLQEELKQLLLVRRGGSGGW